MNTEQAYDAGIQVFTPRVNKHGTHPFAARQSDGPGNGGLADADGERDGQAGVSRASKHECVNAHLRTAVWCVCWCVAREARAVLLCTRWHTIYVCLGAARCGGSDRRQRVSCVQTTAWQPRRVTRVEMGLADGHCSAIRTLSALRPASDASLAISVHSTPMINIFTGFCSGRGLVDPWPLSRGRGRGPFSSINCDPPRKAGNASTATKKKPPALRRECVSTSVWAHGFPPPPSVIYS